MAKKTAPSQPAPKSVVRANVNREVVHSPTFASLYVNDTQFELSPWDVRLVFGQITQAPTADRPTVIVTAVGEVRMSPQHAKRVAQILTQQIASYEEHVGPIPLPQD